jgi:U3 small nucleolar RNA-associated protein 20
LAEKHNRELVTYFLSLAGPDAPSQLQKFKLRAWLELFSKFSNLEALHATDAPREMHPSLIYPDRELQVTSLSCLLAYKLPHLWHHEEKLRLLLDETKWRDELTSHR